MSTFERTEQVLKAWGIDREVKEEFIAKGLPRNWPWAVLGGVEECASLLRELDLHGFRHVRIFVSGGLDEDSIMKYNSFADGYGIGTAISNAPVIDLSMDIVEMDGRPFSKRGKLSGSKSVHRCPRCFRSITLPYGQKTPACLCGGKASNLLLPFYRKAQQADALPKPSEIRKYVMRQLDKVEMT